MSLAGVQTDGAGNVSMMGNQASSMGQSMHGSRSMPNLHNQQEGMHQGGPQDSRPNMPLNPRMSQHSQDDLWQFQSPEFFNSMAQSGGSQQMGAQHMNSSQLGADGSPLILGPGGNVMPGPAGQPPVLGHLADPAGGANVNALGNLESETNIQPAPDDFLIGSCEYDLNSVPNAGFVGELPIKVEREQKRRWQTLLKARNGGPNNPLVQRLEDDPVRKQ
jgi:hypothetical protein